MYGPGTRKIRFLVFTLLGATLSLAPALAGQTIVRDGLGADLDEFMSGIAKEGFSGVLLVEKNGAVVLAKGYGMADRENDIPVTVDTVFDIGSITKQFTAAAILQLEIDHKADVHDTIRRYFSKVPRDKRGITLHHLLSHSSGLRDVFGGDYEPMTREAIIESAMGKTLLTSPERGRYHYSNAGFSLLGAIVEMESGSSYDDYMKRTFFRSLGMARTGYLLPDVDSDLVAVGYRGDERWGKPTDHAWADDGPYWNLRANGGILSTVWDMYTWHRALKDGRVLNDTAREKLFTPHVREGLSDSWYCYGWVWAKTARDTILITHNGGNGIFFADFRRYVDDDSAIIVMTNAADRFTDEHLRAIRRILFATPVSE